MKVGFIGLGRMGQGMAGRILGAGHDLVIYDQVPELLTTLGDAGASVASSVAETVADREVVINMLPHDRALEGLAFSAGGLLETLPKGAIHMPMGTHGVEIIQRLTGAHAEAGHTFVAGHVLGRPDLAATGQLSIVPGGPPETLQQLQPLFDVLGKRTFIAGDEPQSATAVKIAHNFVLGSAIEVIGEGMSHVLRSSAQKSIAVPLCCRRPSALLELVPPALRRVRLPKLVWEHRQKMNVALLATRGEPVLDHHAVQPREDPFDFEAF